MPQTLMTPSAATLKEGNAPAIRVGVGAPAALGEAGKTKEHVGRRVAIHSKQLAHGSIVMLCERVDGETKCYEINSILRSKYNGYRSVLLKF